MAEIYKNLEIVRRRSNEPAFPQHGLGDHSRNFFVGDHALECIFEMPRTVQIARRILLRIRAPVAVSKRDPVDFARKWREPSLIRMRLAGQRQRHHGASVERIFESDDARSLRISARSLERGAASFRAAMDDGG